jgi:hypothetical protein
VSINVDHRVLGGFQCFDAITGSSIEEPLKIDSPQLTLARNPSGVYAVWDAVGFSQYTAFNPVLPWPTPPTSFEITIEDPRCCYLPRRGSIQVPQALPAAPAAAAPPFTATTDQSIVYAPQKITMYRGPAARVGANWAVVRASVSNSASTPVPLWGAVLQVLSGSPPTAGVPAIATGVADANGEALLAVPGLGLSVSDSAAGPVTEATTVATVQVWFDATTLKPPPGWLPDPDDTLQKIAGGTLKTASAAIQFGPGQTVFVPLIVSM